MAPFSFFAAQAVVVWWAPRLTDKIGRKLIVQIFSAISTILYSIIIFTKNKYVLLVMIVLQGMSTPLFFNVSFVYLLELMPRKM